MGGVTRCGATKHDLVERHRRRALDGSSAAWTAWAVRRAAAIGLGSAVRRGYSGDVEGALDQVVDCLRMLDDHYVARAAARATGGPT